MGVVYNGCNEARRPRHCIFEPIIFKLFKGKNNPPLRGRFFWWWWRGDSGVMTEVRGGG